MAGGCSRDTSLPEARRMSALRFNASRKRTLNSTRAPSLLLSPAFGAYTLMSTKAPRSVRTHLQATCSRGDTSYPSEEPNLEKATLASMHAERLPVAGRGTRGGAPALSVYILLSAAKTIDLGPHRRECLCHVCCHPCSPCTASHAVQRLQWTCEGVPCLSWRMTLGKVHA